MIEFSIAKDGSLGFDGNRRMVARVQYDDHDEYHIVPDLRSSSCVLCNDGWQKTGSSFKEHVVVPDMGYAHPACWGRHLTVSELDKWRHLLNQAGFYPLTIKIVANEYDPAPASPMWFEFETNLSGWTRISAGSHPKLRIGARKKIHQIVMVDWQVSKREFDNSPMAQAMVTSQWLNPDYMLVHSHNYEQSLLFLRSLARICGTNNEQSP